MKLVLKENARLLEELIRAGANVSDDLNVIPVIIKHGAFSPKRLERWNYEALQELALKDESLLTSLGAALLTLAGKDLQASVTVNEKKAVSFMLAGKDRAPRLLEILQKRAASESPRFFFVAREYLVPEGEWLRRDFLLALPFPQVRQFGPKFSEKYSSCADFIAQPAPETIKKLLNDPARVGELRFVIFHAINHFTNDHNWLYNNILQVAWDTKNAETVKIVLEALRGHSSFSEFCKDKLVK